MAEVVDAMLQHDVRSLPIVMSSGAPGPLDPTGPVLVGVVGATPAEAALRYAFTEADRRRTALQVAAVGPASAEIDTHLHDLVERWAEKYPDVPLTTRVRRTVDAAVVLVAGSRAVDLLVVQQPADAASSALVDSLRRRAHCPVVVVGD